MCDDENCTTHEALLEFLLNKIVCFKVNIGCGLVQNQNLSVFNDGACQAQQLLLPYRKDIITFRYLRF